MGYAAGIFAFEGDPERNLKKKYSVRPILRFLEDLDGTKHVFRDIGTPEELQHYLSRWVLSAYDGYIGYFSFHGSPGALWLPAGRQKEITLDDLTDWLEGQCRGRIVHFCACSVMRLGDKRLQEFRQRTGAKAVMGYTKNVDWAESMAFEILLYSALANFSRFGDAMNRLDRIAGTLREHLGFKLIR